MTWRSDSPSGAVLYPSGPDTIPDFGWSSGAFAGGTGWSAAGGVPPTLSQSRGEVVGYSLRINPAAGTSFAETASSRPWAWDSLTAQPYYFYARLAAVSGSGTLRVRISYRDNADAEIGSAELAVVIPTDAPLDSAQQMFRAGPLAAPPVGTVKYRLKVGAISGTDTYDAWVDWIFFGHSADLQDMIPAPCMFDSPMNDQLTQDKTTNVAENGEAEVTRFAQLDGAPGYRSGSFRAAYFDDDGLATIEAAWVYLSGHDSGRTRSFTLIGQPYDLTRNFVAKARITSPKRGVARIEESEGLFTWEVEWEELRWEVRTGVGRTTGGGDQVIVVQFEKLIGGTSSLYLTSGPVLSGITSNLYHVLKRDSVQRSEQRFGALSFDTTFPEYTFACVDDGLSITKILAANAEWIDRCIIKIWRGDDLMDFGSFSRKWIGRFAEPERSDGLLTFVSVSAFADLNYPIQPITGAAELDADVPDPTQLSIRLRNVVGLERAFPNLLINPGFETALAGEWKDDVAPAFPPAGTIAAPNSGVLARSTLLKEEGVASLRDGSAGNSHVWNYSYQRVNVSILNINSFSAFINSDGYPGVDGLPEYGGGEFCLIVEEYNAANVLLTTAATQPTTGVLPRPTDYFHMSPNDYNPDIQQMVWAETGVAYTPGTSAAYVKVYLLNRNGGAASTSAYNGCFDECKFQSGVLMRFDNEISAVTALSEVPGATTGVATLAARGMFGSLPKRHTAASKSGAGSVSGQSSGGHCLFHNRYSGHFLDILRRMLTTTSAGDFMAWTPNGPYDDGSGVGLGSYFDATWLGAGWDTEKLYKSAPAWSLLTIYAIGARVSYGGIDWISQHAVNIGNTPALGSHWTQRAIDSYDHSRYLMDFTFDARIDNFKEMAVKECLMPMATILFIDDTGQLDVRILREGELGGEGSILPRDVMNGGKLVFDVAPLEEVVNHITYRFDHDPLATNDIQGSKVGPTPFITERPFTELEMGDETTPSLIRFKERPLIFDVRGLRGFGSVQYGLGQSYYGDRTAFERARVWLTRQRFRVPHYELRLALRKEGLSVGDSIDVTSEAMVNGTLGVMGRVASKMVVRAVGGPDFNSCMMSVSLVAHADLQAIANTEVAGVMPTPVPDHWALFKRPALNSTTNTAFERISIGYRKARVYVRGFANIASLILKYNGQPPPVAPVNGAAPEIPDYMMTRAYGCPKLVLATDLDAVFYTVASEGQIGTIKSLNPWAPTTSYALGKIVLNGFDGLFYISLIGVLNTGKRPDLFTGTFWALFPDKSEYQVVAELRAPLAEENIMFSSGNNTQILANGNSTAATKNQLMFVRICYVNDDWQEGPLSDCRVVSGANFSDDLGDRMYRGKIMQTITDSSGQTRTTWGWGGH